MGIVVISLPVILALIVQIPSVQTALVHYFTEMISERLNEQAKVSVGGVHYSLFNRLIVDDVFVQGTQGDTLLSVHQVAVSLSSANISRKKIRFSSVKLYSGTFNLYNTATSTNIKDVLASLRSEADTAREKEKKPWDIRVTALGLSDFRFTFVNNRKPAPDKDSVINFKNLDVRNININIDNIRLAQDTLFFRIGRLQFEEKSGYRLQRLRADAYICSTRAMLHNVVLMDDYSKLFLKHYAMNYESAADLSDYVEKVRMEADFEDAFLSSKTIGYFAKGVKKTDMKIRLNGLASGTVANLRSDSLFVASESGGTYLLFKFRMRGLPEIEETMITLDIMDLKTHMSDLSKVLKGIMPNISDSVFSFMAPFEHVYLTGNFTGLYNDFVSNAKLSSAIGDIALDMQMNVAEVQKEGLSYRGHIKTKEFLLGTLIKNNNLFGELSIQAEAKGMILPPEKGGFKVDANAYVSEMKFHQYYYQNISLDGKYADNVFTGNVLCNDPNLQFTFKGEAGANPEKADSSYRYHFDFLADVKHANLTELNINRRDTLSIVSGKVEIDYYMRNLLDGQGHILVSGVDYTGPVGTLHYDTCRLEALRKDSLYKIRLRSEIVDADYTGSDNLEYFFNYILKDTYKRHTSKHPPMKDSERAARKHDYLFDARFKTTRGLTNAIFPGVVIADNSELSMVLNTADSLRLQLKSNFLAYKNNVLTKVDISAGSNAEKLNANLKVDDMELFGINLLNARISLDARDAQMDTKLLFDNRKTTGTSKGYVETLTNFLEDSVALQILSSILVLNDSTWKFDPAEIVFRDSLIHFNRLRAHNQSQELKLNGTISHNPGDVLQLNWSNFELATFDAFLKKTSYSLTGKMSGEAKIMDLHNAPVFFTDLTLTNIYVNKNPLGSMELHSRWNNEQKQLLLNAKLHDKDGQLLATSGYYMPTVRYLDISTSFNQFRIHHLNPLLAGLMHDVDGYLSGTVGLSGPIKSLTLKGSNVQLKNAALTVDFLNTRYHFSAPVDITPSKIILRNVEMSDEQNGKGIFSATFSHHHFLNFNLDLALYPQNMLVLNTTERDNNNFYGKAYVSGIATIKGPPSNLVFDITARTEKNTVFAIPVNSKQQAKEMNILTFVQPPAKEQEESYVYNQLLKTEKKSSDMIVNMNIEATPEAQVQIVFDERAGDVIKAFGNGNIKLDLRPAKDVFNVLGDYTIERGDYLFTIQDMGFANKKFYLEQGGRVMFNGNVMRTTLDLSAVYKTKASLNTLIYDTSSVANRRPVDCTITITGNFMNPILSFKVDVQNVDPETRARVQAALNTEEKMIRQFLSLLAFGSFLPDQQSGVTANINLTGTATEMLSNQFSNMLNQLGVSWDVGFVYTPSQNGQNDVIDIAFSKQFFNNRLLINGNVGNAENTSSSGFAGDLDVEYKIDRKDRFRVKLFTHSVDQFSDNLDNGQRSGLGFSYQEEFNNFKELLQSFFRKKKTVEEKPPAKKEDEESGENTSSSLLEFKKE